MKSGNILKIGRLIFGNLASVISVTLLSLLVLELTLNIISLSYKNLNDRGNIVLQKDTVKIMCIGDSHTWGYGAQNAESYPARLEVLLNNSQLGKRFRVINLGVGGMNSALIAEQLEEKYFIYHPDMVIVNGGSNNMWNIAGIESLYYSDVKLPVAHRIKEKMLAYWRRSKLYAFAKLAYINLKYRRTKRNFLEKADLQYHKDEKGNFQGYVTRTFGQIKEEIRYKNGGIFSLWGSFHKDGSFSEDYRKNYRQYVEKSFERMFNFLSREHIPLIVETYLCNDKWGSSYSVTNEALVEFAKHYNVPIVRNDIYLEVNRLARNDFLMFDGHPNARGYNIMAENTLNVLLPLVRKEKEN
jgi:lysophospholipase L1-like esterase